MRKYLREIRIIAACIGLLSAHTSIAQFVVHNNGANVAVTSGCIVTIVTGDLNNNAGSIDNAGRVSVQGNLINGDVLTGAGSSTGIFNVSGDWENNAIFSADQSLVNLNGANQLVTGSVVSSFYNLNILGIGVKTLGIDAEVQGLLQLNNLQFATATNTLRVLNTSSSAITENGGFVSSLGAGRLSWVMNSTNTYVFPLGSSVGTLRIRPLAITPSSTSQNTFAARMANVNATLEGFDVNETAPELCFVNNQFYHQIDHVLGSDAPSVTQYFVPANDGNWANGAHWQGTPQWEDMGNEVAGTSGGYNTITNSGWTDFNQPAFVLANALPDVSIAAVSPLCASGSPISLQASPSGGSFYGTGVSNGVFSPAFAGAGTHTVSYVYQDGFGCENTAEIQIEVNQAPTLTITSSNNGSLQLCSGQTLTLTASSGFTNYQWNNSQQTSSITVGASGQYSVTATASNGCVSSSVVANVTVQPSPNPSVTANGPIAFCEGQSVTLSTANGQGSYLWSGTGSTTPSTVVLQAGVYSVTVTNQYGCQGISNPITVDVTPQDDAVILESGNDLTVSPQGSGYQWFLNGDPIPGATGIDYVAIQSGNYHVEYIGPNGCPTSTYVLEFTLQVGVDEYSIFDVLDVYPNPGKGEFTIRGMMPTMEDVTIELTNMLGQSLQPAVRINDTNNFTRPMDISKYANGVYFIRITAGDSLVTVRYVKS
ncbi:MAG: T9SS type A sorting domain-containing protein [Flavobacteriales bacterium]|nr:T9SS type A sorting domain-containing protein [Flavobacteriales bacterium]